MPQAPAALATTQIGAARRPIQSGEYQVLFSQEPIYELGSLEITGANAASVSLDAGFAVALAARPSDVVVALRTSGYAGGSAIAVQLIGTDQTNAALSGVGQVRFPNWSGQPNNQLPIGLAVDVVVPDGKKFKTINTVNVSAAAVAKGTKLRIYGNPDTSTYVRVGCTTGASFNTPARPGRNIGCGMDGTAFSAKGMSRPGEITVTAKDSNTSGLMPFNGSNVSVMVQGVIDDTVTAVRYYLSRFDVAVRKQIGDGETEATDEAQGVYEGFMMVIAPDA